jgi:hypothetical protein
MVGEGEDDSSPINGQGNEANQAPAQSIIPHHAAHHSRSDSSFSMDSFVMDVAPINKETVEENHASTISETKLSPLKIHETIDRNRANTGQSYDSNLPPTPAHPFFSGNESDGYSDGSIVFNSPTKQSLQGSYQQPQQLKHTAASDSKVRKDRFPSFDSAGSSGSVVKKVVPPMRSVNVAPNPKILPYHERRKLMQLRQSQQEAAAAAQIPLHYQQQQPQHHARDQTPPRPEMPQQQQQRPQFMPQPHPSFLIPHGPQPPPGYYNVHSQPAPPNSYLPFPPSHAQQQQQQQQQQQYFGMMMPPLPSSNYAFPPAIMMHPMAPFPPNSDYRPDNRQFEEHPHPQPSNMPPSFDRAERPHGNHSLTIEPMSSSAQATMVTPPLHTQHIMDNSPYSRPPPQQRLPPYRRVSGQSADVGDQLLTSSSYDSSDCVDFPQTASQGIVMSGRNSKGAAPPPPPPPPLPPPETPHPSSLLIRQDSLGSVSSLGSLDRSGRDNASRTNASFFDRFNPWASPPKEPNVTDFHRKNQAFLTKMERIQGLSSPSPLQMAKR